jgi:hypothetical protein
VDLPASSPELVRPWRTATLVATAIAGVELVLLVVVGIVLLGKSLAPHVHAAAAHHALASAPAVASHPAPATTPKRSHPTRAAAAALSRGHTQVIVLNGNGVQGAAAQTAALVKARGYAVKQVGNAPRTGYARTMIMYRPGFRSEAVRFGRDMGTGAVSPLDGMTTAQLHGAHLVLIIGTSS